MARVIAEAARPALVIAHNKTLAAQLCNEFRELLPAAAVEYFVSYYDYYQPEAYIAATDTYIEKDSSINDEIDRLRHAATAALLARRDVVIVASVSCIYGLGSAEIYRDRVLLLTVGEEHPREKIFRRLVETPVPAQRHGARARPLPGARRHARGAAGRRRDGLPHLDVRRRGREHHRVRPAHRRGATASSSTWRSTRRPTTSPRRETIDRSIKEIRAELEEQVALFESAGKLVEAHRLRQRTEYDMEMMRELGLLLGHRELLAHPRRAPAGGAAAHAARLLPRRLPLLHRRVAQHDGAAARACTRATARARSR